MQKFLRPSRIAGVLASTALIGALAVAPTASSAARLAHLSPGTCVATGTATPSLSGAVSLTLRKAGGGGQCSVTVQGRWAAHSSVFATSYASDATVSPSGSWTAPIASAQLRGTVSGTLAPSSTGAAGASTVYRSIDCVITYSPFSIRCTFNIGSSSA